MTTKMTPPTGTTKLMKPIRLYAPITRVDAKERIVEGYCYVNAVVGDGIDLTRKSMVKASEDYMKWGAIRAMHQPVAAGKAEAVTWDDRGCFLRAQITDDAEWAKCENGTYKGFSVGVNPVVMRGNKTETVKWIENSLVDRPFDEDASFVIARADGVGEGALDKEVEVTILPEADGSEGPLISDDIFSVPLSELLLAEGTDITRIKTKKLAKMAKKIGKVSSALSNQYRAAEAELKRRDSADTTPSGPAAVLPKTEVAPKAEPAPADAATVQRLTQLETTLTRLQSDLTVKNSELKKAGKKIKRLEAQPAAGPQPVRFPAALERTFTANELTETGTSDEDVSALRAKRDALVESAQKEPDAGKRQEASHEIGLLTTQLAELGG